MPGNGLEAAGAIKWYRRDCGQALWSGLLQSLKGRAALGRLIGRPDRGDEGGQKAHIEMPFRAQA